LTAVLTAILLTLLTTVLLTFLSILTTVLLTLLTVLLAVLTASVLVLVLILTIVVITGNVIAAVVVVVVAVVIAVVVAAIVSAVVATVVSAVVVATVVSAVVPTIVITTIRNGEVDNIIKGTMLSNSDEGRLMVGSGVDRTSAIGTRGKATGDSGGENTIDGRIVESLEEGEFRGIGHGGRCEGVNSFDNNMRVSDEDTIAVNLSRGGKIIGLGINKVASVKIRDGNVDSEILVGGDGIEVLGGLELGRRHTSRGENATHDRGVAATARDLASVGEGDILLGGAEVDKVVLRGQGGNLARCGGALTVLRETRLDLGWIEGERVLDIPSIVSAVTRVVVIVVPAVIVVPTVVVVPAVVVVIVVSTVVIVVSTVIAVISTIPAAFLVVISVIVIVALVVSFAALRNARRESVARLGHGESGDLLSKREGDEKDREDAGELHDR
jgi:hypothetical protein